jgi:serine/threonine protein kinase
VKKMLMLNPDDRMSAKDALRHPWLRLSKDRLSLVMLQGTSQRLKTFNARMKLRSAMIALDWISGLKKISWTSSKNLSSDASQSSVSSGESNPVLIKMKRQQEKEKEKARRNAAQLEI